MEGAADNLVAAQGPTGQNRSHSGLAQRRDGTPKMTEFSDPVLSGSTPFWSASFVTFEGQGLEEIVGPEDADAVLPTGR